MTEGLAYMDVINFTAANNTNLNSIGVEMSKVKLLMYIIMNACLCSAGTIDGLLQSSPNSNFNVVHNVANSNLVQVNTATTPSGNNVTALVECRAESIVQQFA